VIRVLYRWRVAAEEARRFPSWWHEGTERIRSTYQGALGSMLLRAHDDQEVFVGIARWESVEALQAFRRAAGPIVFEGAELESISIFEELDDLTITTTATD
jgi:heme-degrading monooxygenase HmoA